jgi:hypothetical protein
MSNSQRTRPSHQLMRELTVPCIMVIGIALFVFDSMHLSSEALVFPSVLVAVILAAIAWVIVVHLKGDGSASAPPAMEDDEEGGPIIAATPWLLVALPAVLVASFNTLGVLPALILLVFGAQAVFSLRNPVRSLLIAVAVVAPTYAVFKYILYARFPVGIFGLG